MEALGVPRDERNSVPLGSDVLFLLPALVSGWLAMDEMLVSASVAARPPGISPFCPSREKGGRGWFCFLRGVGCLAPADFEWMIFQGNSVLTEHHVAEVGGVGVF